MPNNYKMDMRRNYMFGSNFRAIEMGPEHFQFGVLSSQRIIIRVVQHQSKGNYIAIRRAAS